MAISRDIKLIIKEDKASLEQNLYVYQDDKNIDIYFTVVDYKYRVTKELLFKSLENAFASATVLKPNNQDSFKIDKFPLVEGKVKFTITEEFTDELDEIGIYKLQFHIHDDSNARITIPFIEFEVKELIANVKDDINSNLVGNAIVGISKLEEVSESDTTIKFVEGKVYPKTNWKTGDLITADKLNKVETKLEELDGRGVDLTGYVTGEDLLLGLSDKSDNNHNHDDNYAKKIHSHDYEPSFNKNTAFNKNFGIGNDDVSRGNHTHTDYSLTNHNHDSSYASKTHNHSDYITNNIFNGALNNHKFWSGTQMQYDAIASKDTDTLYFIIE